MAFKNYKKFTKLITYQAVNNLNFSTNCSIESLIKNIKLSILLCIVSINLCISTDKITSHQILHQSKNSLINLQKLSKHHYSNFSSLFSLDANMKNKIQINKNTTFHSLLSPSQLHQNYSLISSSSSISTNKSSFFLKKNNLLPIASKLNQFQNECPSLLPIYKSNYSPSKNNNLNVSLCTCYTFDDGIYIECDQATNLDNIKYALSQLKNYLIKSFTINYLNNTIDKLVDAINFPYSSNLLKIERLQISFCTFENSNELFFNLIKNNLRQLSLTNCQLKTFPQSAIKRLKHLEVLDLDTNYLERLESYSFYGLSLILLNLQSNKLKTLLEYSFAGLENSLEELNLMHNSLTIFPLIALQRLRKLRNLKLSNNLIEDLLDDDFIQFMILQNLDLSFNQLRELNDRSFITMPKLVTLSLAFNRLKTLVGNPFIHLLELETLDLSHNLIRLLENQVFTNLANLRTLDLSGNHLHSLSNKIFNPLYNLLELYLTYNNILQISNQTFINNNQLQVLYLSHNALNEIKYDTFYQLNLLQKLHLSFNQLQEINVNLFKNNSFLRTLALDNNLIVNLKAGCFKELIELRDLRLQHNLLKNVEKNVFFLFSNLQELHLEYNQIEKIEYQALKNLFTLQYLNLQGNQLIEIDDVFLNIYPSSVKHIQLNYNKILNIHPDAFKNQKQLEVIWINHNKLKKLTLGIFSDLFNCEKLYLQYNEIATIEIGVFSNMSKLTYLNLEHNKLASLNRDIFKGAIELNELYLANNHIIDIDMLAFQTLQNMRILNLDNNQIYVLKKGVFNNNFSQLEQLYLNNIQIVEFDLDLFNNLTNLNKLEISDNNLYVNHLNLSELKNLTELNLIHNNLSYSNSIDELCKLKNLLKLDVSLTNFYLNKLGYLLQCLPKLKVLKLNRNQITTIEKKHFLTYQLLNSSIESIPLEKLYLENNKLTSIPPIEIMFLFKNVKYLCLAGNSIKKITRYQLQFNENLQLLNLSSNGLSVLDSLSFNNLSKLIILDLSNNVMRSLPANAFLGLINLEELYLSNNWFQHMPNNLFISNLPSLRYLILNNNPLIRIREDLSVTSNFKNLQLLNLSNCTLSIIASHDFYILSSLNTLILSNNQISKISPGSFWPLNKLNNLDLSNNKLELLPEERLTGLHELIFLNLTNNQLMEMPSFNRDLSKIQTLDLSRNRLTRLNTFGSLGKSLLNTYLNGNMISWIDNNLFKNFTSLKILDLRKNHLTYLSELIFKPIEVTLEQLFISGNPFHCNCRLVSLWEWLHEHNRLFNKNEIDILCTQPDKLAETSLIKVNPIDFCPIPIILSLEIVKLSYDLIKIKWNVQNDSLIASFTLDYYETKNLHSIPISRQVSATNRQIDLNHLLPTTQYTICIKANSKHLQSFTNKLIAHSVENHPTNSHNSLTSNRKCVQSKTLDFSKRTPIQISTLSLIIILGIIFGIFLMCIIVLILGIKYRQRRTGDLSNSTSAEIKISNELPEEYISYRHFSLPSFENVYS